MKIAYTFAQGRGDTDLLLASLADDLAKHGFTTAGTVQINVMDKETGACDMDVRVLPAGPVIRISQSLGPQSRGCRLDPSALERAVGLAGETLASGADCLIVNKFGKHEADGRGFRPLIGEAAARDIPVIVGVGRMNQPAFHEFTGDCAQEVAPDVESLRQWLEAVTAPEKAAP